MKVSVVMPAYNAARYIEASISSVQAQSFSDWELLVIDDASNDETLKILERMSGKESRIRVLRNESNRGVAESRNRGVLEAKGEWIAFLDSDDLWRADKLEKQLGLIDTNSQCDMVFCAARCISEDGCETGKVFEVPAGIDYRAILGANNIVCSSVVIRKSWIVRYPFASGELHEDFICWARMLRDGCRALGMQEPMVKYRLRRGSKSFNKLKSAKMMINSYRQLGVSFTTSLISFAKYTLHGVERYFL